MCTGRLDLSFLLRAFSDGADGVVIGACWPGECHYVTQGNYDALGNVLLCKKLLRRIGLDPERVRLAWISAAEGTRFAEVMNEFSEHLHQLGPLGVAEGLAPGAMKRDLAALLKLVPYLKLVERERLRVPARTEKSYNEFFAGEQTEKLLDALFSDKLDMCRILQLLGDGPLSTGEIAKALGLSPSEVARHMNASSRQGLVKYEPERGCYALA